MTYWLPANSFMIYSAKAYSRIHSIRFRAATYLFGRLLLNILSMRSVIRNPPTTLLVAATMAIVPRTVANVLLRSPTITIAPTTAMASSALVSDISGVCSKGETWRMTSKPMKQASIKINSASIRFSFTMLSSSQLLLRSRQSQCRQLEKLAHPRVHDFTTAGDHGLANNLILQVELQLAVFHHVGKKRGDI